MYVWRTTIYPSKINFLRFIGLTNVTIVTNRISRHSIMMIELGWVMMGISSVNRDGFGLWAVEYQRGWWPFGVNIWTFASSYVTHQHCKSAPPCFLSSLEYNVSPAPYKVRHGLSAAKTAMEFDHLLRARESWPMFMAHLTIVQTGATRRDGAVKASLIDRSQREFQFPARGGGDGLCRCLPVGT